MTRRLAVVAVVLLALAGCAKNTPKASPTAETILGTASANPTATAKPTPGTGATSLPPKTSVTTAPPTGPQIVFFKIKLQPNCQSSGPGGSFPGSITLEWAVTGGPTSVTISIDSPGIYGEYPTAHTEKFNFTCTETSGMKTKHTYLLRTVGGGPVQQKTITGEATFH